MGKCSVLHDGILNTGQMKASDMMDDKEKKRRSKKSKAVVTVKNIFFFERSVILLLTHNYRVKTWWQCKNVKM